MTKPKRFRAEFYLPADGNWLDRQSFLHALETLEPEIKQEHGGIGVMESLERDVLPRYDKDSELNNYCTKDKGRSHVDEVVYQFHQGSLTGYGRALIGWLVRWNLQEDWLLEVATVTLRDWAGEEPRPGLAYQRPGSFTPPQNIELDQRFSAPDLLQCISPESGFRYAPFEMRRADVQKRFDSWREELEKRFKLFLDAQDKEALVRGGERTGEVEQFYKFEWLVLWQVYKWSDKKIADYYNDLNQTCKDSGSIGRSRRRLAEDIGLRLRK